MDKILKHNSRIFGVQIPTLLLYGGVAFGCYSLFKGSKDGISSGIANLFKSSTEIQEEELLKQSFTSLKDNPAVQSQMTVANMNKANLLQNAMNGIGTDQTTIVDVFKSITGPNQMAAVFLSYGKRSIGWLYSEYLFPTSEGDLITNLRSELSSSDLNKNRETDKNKPAWSIQAKINWLQSFK